MATGKFKTGDIVVLKSGSENMTVEAYTDDDYIICTYWNGGNMLKPNFEGIRNRRWFTYAFG